MSQPENGWRSLFLEKAAERLYRCDRHLIGAGKERAATAKLCCHLWSILGEEGFQKSFPQVRVDVDFGREGEKAKKNSAGTQVYPDIIVHVPGPDRTGNIVVVEAKGYWSANADGADDKVKLREYKAVQRYRLAYFILFENERAVIEEIK